MSDPTRPAPERTDEQLADALYAIPALRRSEERKILDEAAARLRSHGKALETIANHVHCTSRGVGDYGIGVQDGHRCAANIAREVIDV